MAQDGTFLSDLKGSSLLIELFVVCRFCFRAHHALSDSLERAYRTGQPLLRFYPIMAIGCPGITHRALLSHQLLYQLRYQTVELLIVLLY